VAWGKRIIRRQATKKPHRTPGKFSDEASTSNPERNLEMLTAIVTQPDEYRNFGFESLTSDERAEYEAWSDEANAGTRDPLPQDFISYRELIEQDMWKEAYHLNRLVPVDDDDDPDLLKLAGWTPVDGRINNPEEIRQILVDLPNGVRTSINDCDVWKQSPIAYNARYTPNENWRVQAGTVNDVIELVTMTFRQWNLRQRQAA